MTFVTPALDTLQSLSTREEWAMSEQFPETDYILAHWWTTTQVAEKLDLSTAHVRRMCINKELRARRIANQWYIDPSSTFGYERYARKGED